MAGPGSNDYYLNTLIPSCKEIKSGAIPTRGQNLKLMKTKTTFEQKTLADKYLEFVNDWLTISAMAEHYGYSTGQMGVIIERGKREYNLNWTRVKFKKIVKDQVSDIASEINQAAENYASLSICENLEPEQALKLARDFVINNLANKLANSLSDQFIESNK